MHWRCADFGEAPVKITDTSSVSLKVGRHTMNTTTMNSTLRFCNAQETKVFRDTSESVHRHIVSYHSGVTFDAIARKNVLVGSRFPTQTTCIATHLQLKPKKPSGCSAVVDGI